MAITVICNTGALQITREQEFWLGLRLGFKVRVSVSYVTWSYISHLIADISSNLQI